VVGALLQSAGALAATPPKEPTSATPAPEQPSGTHYRAGALSAGRHVRVDADGVSGWLLARGAPAERWEQRFVALHHAERALRVFADDTGASPAERVVGLREGSAVADVSLDDAFGNVFLWTVTDATGTRATLATVRAQDRERWIEAVQRAVGGQLASPASSAAALGAAGRAPATPAATAPPAREKRFLLRSAPSFDASGLAGSAFSTLEKRAAFREAVRWLDAAFPRHGPPGWASPDDWREVEARDGTRVYVPSGERGLDGRWPALAAAFVPGRAPLSVAAVANDVARQPWWDETLDRVDVREVTALGVRARLTERRSLVRLTLGLRCAASHDVERACWPDGDQWYVATRGATFASAMRAAPAAHGTVVAYVVDGSFDRDRALDASSLGPASWRDAAFPAAANRSRAAGVVRGLRAHALEAALPSAP